MSQSLLLHLSLCVNANCSACACESVNALGVRARVFSSLPHRLAVGYRPTVILGWKESVQKGKASAGLLSDLLQLTGRKAWLAANLTCSKKERKAEKQVERRVLAKERF